MRLRLLLLTLIPLCWLAAAAAPAHAARGLEIGLQDDSVLLSQAYYGREAGLDRAQEMGVTHLRVNVPWAGVLGAQAHTKRKPAVLSYNFAAHDELIAAAAARGIRVQLTLVGPAPRWASGNRKVSNFRPSAKRYAAFAAAAAKHFRGRVARYSIWNEPNWHSLLAPQKTAARQYRGLYLAGWRAVKRADPKAKVLFGELAPQGRTSRRSGRLAIAPLKFVRAALCLTDRYKRKRGCATVRTDGFAQHPYDFTHKPTYKRIPRDDVTIGTLSHLDRALTKLRRAGALKTPAGRKPPVYLTEFGYFATGGRRLSEAKRARYVRQAFAVARKAPNVRQLLYYQLVQNRALGWNSGIIGMDGSFGKPFQALRRWSFGEHKAGRLHPLRGPLSLPAVPVRPLQ